MIIKKAYFSFFLLAGMVIFMSCRQSAGRGPSPAGQQYTSDTAAVKAYFLKAAGFAKTNPDSMQYYDAQALALAQAVGFAEGVARIKTEQAWYLRVKGNYVEAVSLSLAAIQPAVKSNLHG
jgi:hypothetical protein